MWRLVKPTECQLIEILIDLARQPVTTLRPDEPAVQVNEQRLLGRGEATFETAREAMQQWRMVPPLVDLFWVERRPVVGVTVATGMSCSGLYSLQPCRITEITDRRDERGAEFTLTWATVQGHPFRGRESFSLEWDRASDEVEYRVHSLAVHLGWLRCTPQRVLRLRQSFAVESCDSLQQSVAGSRLHAAVTDSQVSL